MSMICQPCSTGTFSIAYEDGGPATAVWGWISVALMNIFVALSMAEIVSSYPIAGGPYFWCDPASSLRSHHTSHKLPQVLCYSFSSASISSTGPRVASYVPVWSLCGMVLECI